MRRDSWQFLFCLLYKPTYLNFIKKKIKDCDFDHAKRSSADTR